MSVLDRLCGRVFVGLLVGLGLGFAFSLSGCGPKLSPTPTIVAVGGIDPFEHLHPADRHPDVRLFFATDRTPNDRDDLSAGFTARRSAQLLLGEVSVGIGPDDLTWDELHALSLDPDRTRPGGVRLHLDRNSIRDYGALWSTVLPDDVIGEFVEFRSFLESRGNVPDGVRGPFAAAIDDALDRTRSRDVFIYLHGYNNSFERAAIFTAEMSHLLGRDGVFVTYAWSARDALLGYVHDRESALFSVGHFRRFLDFLADETDCRRIHIIAHSTGASLAVRSLRELRLLNVDLDREELEKKQRIGQLVLAAPDLDVAIFRSHFVEAFQHLPQRITVYINRRDGLLDLAAGLIYGLARLGAPGPTDFTEAELESLSGSSLLQFVDVGDAPTTEFTGHLYLLTSPWVSSDFFLLMKTQWGVERRGLHDEDGDFAWGFPEDYPEVLREIGEQLRSQR